MSEATIEQLKAAHKRLVILEVSGNVLAFKPLTRAMVQDLKKHITNKPENAVELSINACDFCCVLGKERFTELANLYPLAFAGSFGAPGVIDLLFDLARGGAVLRTE